MWCSMVVTRQQAHYSHVQVRGVWPVCGGTGRGVWCSMVVTRQQAHYSHVQVRGCGQSVVAQGGECGVLWWSLAVV